MLSETKILSDKVAARIVGQLRNDVRDLFDEKSLDREWLHTDVLDLFGADADARVSQTLNDESGIGALMDLLGVADARGLLDLLARRRAIDWEGKGDRPCRIRCLAAGGGVGDVGAHGPAGTEK